MPVTPGLDQVPPFIPRAVTEEDIRLFLIDKSPDDNPLLDDVEMSTEEIEKAIGIAIDRYNSIPPLVHIITSSSVAPYYLLMLGTCGTLLRMKAVNLMRNRLDYSQKNGTAVQDKGMGQEYLAVAREMLEEFDTKCRELKVTVNIDNCYGSIGSAYGRGSVH